MTAQQSQPGEMFFSPTRTHIFPECPGLSNPMLTAEAPHGGEDSTKKH